MFNEYDVIKSKRKLSNKVQADTIGTILVKYTQPVEGYEVEFVDEHGEFLDLLTIYPDDIYKVDKSE